MSDAQTWTTIGGLLTATLGYMALTVRLFNSTMNAKFDAVHHRIEALSEVMMHGFDQIDRRFEQVDKRFEQVDKRLDRIEDRVDSLDRDVHAITRRILGDGPDQL